MNETETSEGLDTMNIPVAFAPLCGRPLKNASERLRWMYEEEPH